MYRLIHSADWQLGARFSQLGRHESHFRQARLEALQRTLAPAREHQADAFFIAGNLFEDNQVDHALVAAVVDLFHTYPDIPTYILPGNHDLHTGPDLIWQCRPIVEAPANAHILREAGTVELDASLPQDAIKIGITHSVLAIESERQPNDFPIEPNAATRAGLEGTDGRRILMPGTPEPDRLENTLDITSTASK